MAGKIMRLSFIMLSYTILLAACAGQKIIVPTITVTNTDAPTSTETETPSPVATLTQSPTRTTTPTNITTPTETSIPLPTSLSGAVFLVGNDKKPFITTVELRDMHTLVVFGEGKTNTRGEYKISNLEPGTYDLWILITSRPAMIAGCYDVAPADDKWEMGVLFKQGMGLTYEDAYLSKGLFLWQVSSSSEMQIEGVYAVLPYFRVEPGIYNKMVVTMQCK